MPPSRLLHAVTIVAALAGCGGERAQSDPTSELRRLLAECDRDGDGRVSARDEGSAHGALHFTLRAVEGAPIVLSGAERIALASDVLARAVLHRDTRVRRAALAVSRVDVVHALVRRSWHALTRRSDRLDDIVRVLDGSRVSPRDRRRYVYYPADDAAAGARLERERVALGRADVRLVAIPRALDASWLERLDVQRGLLYLPRPYIVPGGHFDEMYGWDSYFMARGALEDGELELAIGMLEDLAYQLERYGKIGNSNRSYHRGRSQPPFFTRLAIVVTDRMAAGPRREALLRRVAAAAERELHEVWLAPPRITDTGLSLYRDEREGPLPEVRPSRYRVWIDEPEFLLHQRAVRESGWDMTHRFGDRGHRTLPVCLNALLYGYERDLAEIYRRVDGPLSTDASRLEAAAAERKSRIDRLLWDEARGLYFDWDIDRRERNTYEHVASFYALWVGLASRAQAARIERSLPLFEMPGGLAVSSERSRRRAGGEDLQWDWPNGWAPHQVIAIEGLRRYGFTADADRIAVGWLSMIFDVAGANDALIKEKYDVVARTADVPAEYGNQGGDRGPLATYSRSCRRWPRPPSCVTLTLRDALERPIGFGWTNASVTLLLRGLSADGRRGLELTSRAR